MTTIAFSLARASPCAARWSATASLGAVLAGLTMASCALPAACQPAALRESGRAYFEGTAALEASVHGQQVPLPASASRCANCHVGPTAGVRREPAPQVRGDAVGPALNPRTLASVAARRGGPPSHYSASSLCTLLRTGVDPAGVLVQRVMPRYQVDDHQCEALWAYLGKHP